MDEPEWRKLSIDAKLGHLHELLHALIQHVDDVSTKLAHLQRASRPRTIDAVEEPSKAEEAPGDRLETHGEAPQH